jgi:NitT/TauT family transport system permease protein
MITDRTLPGRNHPNLAPSDVQLVQRVAEDNARDERRSRGSIVLWRLGLAVVALGLWQLLSGNLLDPFFFSSPGAIIVQLFEWIQSGTLWFHLTFTLTEMLSGYLIGAVLGLTLGFIFGLVYYLYEISEPVIMVIYSIPTVAVAPLLIIWFGLGLTPKVVLAAFFVFFVVFMNTVAGIRNVNKQFLDIARVMGASRWDMISKIIVPNSYPFLLTALRVTLPTALIGAVVGEFVGSNRGVAYLIMAASLRYNTAGTFGALIVLATVVLLVNTLLSPIEARLMRWKPKVELLQ